MSLTSFMPVNSLQYICRSNLRADWVKSDSACMDGQCFPRRFEAAPLSLAFQSDTFSMTVRCVITIRTSLVRLTPSLVKYEPVPSGILTRVAFEVRT